MNILCSTGKFGISENSRRVHHESEIVRSEEEERSEIAIPSSPQRWAKFPKAPWEINRFDIWIAIMRTWLRGIKAARRWRWVARGRRWQRGRDGRVSGEMRRRALSWNWANVPSWKTRGSYRPEFSFNNRVIIHLGHLLHSRLVSSFRVIFPRTFCRRHTPFLSLSLSLSLF